MAETDTGVAAGGLGKVIGDATIAFNHSNVMYPLVHAKQAVQGAITVQFPDYTKVASSSVAAVSYFVIGLPFWLINVYGP